MKLLSEIITNVTNRNIHNFTDAQISGIYYDSRTVSANGIFVAIQGEKVSGDTFIAKAIDQGAVVIVTEQQISVPDSIVVIEVANARIALAELSNAFFDFPSNKLTVVGITGTNGKTTSSFLLKSLLTYTGKNVGIIGTTGIYFADKFLPATHTTPESPIICELLVEMMGYGIDTVVMEVSSHSLSLYRVYGIHFSVVMFTNLTQDHLDYHKTMLEYAKAKKMLFDMVDSSANAVLFESDEWASFMVEDCKAHQKYVVSRNVQHKDNDYQQCLVSNEQSTFDGISFVLNLKNETTSFVSSSLVGTFNIENLSICIVVAKILTNIPLQFFVEHCKSIVAAPGRMESILLSKGVRAFVDYAHTPDALEKVLLTAKENTKGGKLIVVFGCGGNRDSIKRPLMGKIASVIADVVVITNDNPRDDEPLAIIDDIRSGIDSPFDSVIVIEHRASAIQKAVELSVSGDCIVVAGKGHENYQIIKGEKSYFSDRDELLQYQ
jgi:UDP-N-acetylmuramoyl-L-alanyl-D-glutamate--2,6-diaminopimelate ligase